MVCSFVVEIVLSKWRGLLQTTFLTSTRTRQFPQTKMCKNVFRKIYRKHNFYRGGQFGKNRGEVEVLLLIKTVKHIGLICFFDSIRCTNSFVQIEGNSLFKLKQGNFQKPRCSRRFHKKLFVVIDLAARTVIGRSSKYAADREQGRSPNLQTTKS